MQMNTLQQDKLKAALAKAKNVGRVEDSVTIAGCAIVLQSLSPDEYEAIETAIRGLDEMAYLNAYQIEHLCRSIVEIEGIDFRDTQFVELDNGKKVEKHAWIRDEVLRSWSRESVVSAWRKMMEVFVKADEKAKEGIHFSIDEETEEGRFRRLIGEMKEASEDLPDELVTRILDEEGLLLKTTKAEMDAVNEALKEAETPATPEPIPSAPVAPPPQPTMSQAEAANLMQNRTPMNRQAVDVPTPQSQTTAVVAPTSRRVEVPPEIREAAIPIQELSRKERPAMPVIQTAPSEVVEIKRPLPVGQPVIDSPPAGGINTRYRPPQRRP
jgi:hypothetical protein